MQASRLLLLQLVSGSFWSSQNGVRRLSKLSDGFSSLPQERKWVCKRGLIFWSVWLINSMSNSLIFLSRSAEWQCLTVPFRIFSVPRFAQFSVNPHRVSDLSWEAGAWPAVLLKRRWLGRELKVHIVEICFLVPLLGAICGSGGAFGTHVICGMSWQSNLKSLQLGAKTTLGEACLFVYKFQMTSFLEVHEVHPKQIIFLCWMGRPKGEVQRKKNGWAFLMSKLT